jgi:putative hemolysin
MMKWIIVFIMLVSLAIVGCQSSNQPPNTGIANPASVYCEKQGGTLEIVTEEAGQRGICTLEDGTQCDEWAYFRGECPNNCSAGCPQYPPVAPDFCANGKIVAGQTDNCGCQGPPNCELVACTLEAKICPDGTAVGRVGPNCEFAQCPASPQ